MSTKSPLKARRNNSRSRIEKILQIFRHPSSEKEKMIRIALEFDHGINFSKRYPRAVTGFGGVLLDSDTSAYQEAYNLGYFLVDELGYYVATGGGPGIMEALNKGAYDAKGNSLGICIKLPQYNQRELQNEYLTDSISCKYFFTRKFFLSAIGEILFFFAGGDGTMDEYYEMITLVQTGKFDPPPPIILVDDDKEFWKIRLRQDRDLMLHRYHTIEKKDLQIPHRVHGAEGAKRYIRRLIREYNLVPPKPLSEQKAVQ